MSDPVRERARWLEEQLRRHLEALLCRPSLLDEPQLLRNTAAALAAAVPAAEALQALAGTGHAVAGAGEPAASSTTRHPRVAAQLRSVRVPA